MQWEFSSGSTSIRSAGQRQHAHTHSQYHSHALIAIPNMQFDSIGEARLLHNMSRGDMPHSSLSLYMYVKLSKSWLRGLFLYSFLFFSSRLFISFSLLRCFASVLFAHSFFASTASCICVGPCIAWTIFFCSQCLGQNAKCVLFGIGKRKPIYNINEM